jgi:phage shock protein C
MTRKKFQLDRRNGKLMGVCAGIAEYTGVDVTIVRVATVVVTLLGAFPWTLIAYGVAAWAAKPKVSRDEGYSRQRVSTHDLKQSMRDIDHRMAAIDSYVASTNSPLAREIEELR